MKKLFGILLVVLLAMGLTFGPAAQAFDRDVGTFKEWYNDDGSKKEYVDLSTSLVRVFVSGTADASLPIWDSNNKIHMVRASGMFAQSGTGTLVRNGNKYYVITAAHVVTCSWVDVNMSKWLSYITPPIECTSMNITVGMSEMGSVKSKIKYIDRETDVAIVELDATWIPAEPIGYELAWTYRFSPYGGVQDKIDMEDATVVMVRYRTLDDLSAFSDWAELRPGKIHANRPHLPDGIEGADRDFVMSWFNPNDVTMTNTIYPGDSGAPVFMFEDGKPVIVGIARAAASTDSETLTYFTRIDFIKRIIETEGL